MGVSLLLFRVVDGWGRGREGEKMGYIAEKFVITENLCNLAHYLTTTIN